MVGKGWWGRAGGEGVVGKKERKGKKEKINLNKTNQKKKNRVVAAFPVNSIDKLFKCNILCGSSVHVVVFLVR